MKYAKDIKEKFYFYKNKPNDKIWQVDFYEMIGIKAVSFDKEKILFLFGDYPQNFTPEEKAIFDKENPYWAKFFKNK